jgi:amino acid transporter
MINNKNTLIFGLVAGLISSIWLIIFPFLDASTFDYDKGMLYGYTAMIIAFSLIFVGIKNYRDRFNNGELSFKRGFLIGLSITVIASTIYVVTWLIDYYFFMPDFFDTMAKSYKESLMASGASAEELKDAMVKMAQYKEWYKNPLFNAAITYTEILPLGLIISLIAAAILKRKNTSL